MATNEVAPAVDPQEKDAVEKAEGNSNKELQKESDLQEDDDKVTSAPALAPAGDKSSVFVVGYTGEVGKELVKELLRRSSHWSRVVLIGRRKVSLDGDLYKDVEQQVVDFDKLEEHADVFKGIDIGFCSLGTTRGKSGAAGFYRVDHDYVIGTADLAKAGGCKQFHLVSSVGADSTSCVLYARTKGEVENYLKNLAFDNAFIYRPGALLCEREERRMFERCMLCLLSPCFKCCPTRLSVPTTTVAMAMVNCALAPPGDQKVQVLENRDIHRKAE